MTRPRRRGEESPGRRRSTRANTDPDATAADELETLEPVEDLETLEAIEDAELDTLEAIDAVPAPDERVRGRIESGPDAVSITLEVDDMDKGDVGPAVEASLGALVAEHAARLRWQAVVVEFAGDALIPSAAKAVCGEVLGAARARSVTVRRGMGDESLFEHEPPRLGFEVEDEGDAVVIAVDTDGIEPIDLSALLIAAVEGTRDRVPGKRITMRFAGSTRPGAEIADRVAEILSGAGASRFEIDTGTGSRVLFDNELAARVSVASAVESDFDTELRIDVSDDRMAEVFEIALPEHREAIDGQRVILRLEGADAHAAVVAALRDLGAIVVAISAENGPQILWPELLGVEPGAVETVVRVAPNGRDHRSVMRAFGKEIDGHREAVAGLAVLVDWPAEFDLDGELEGVANGLLEFGATRVAYSFGGDRREPVVPVPIAVDELEDRVTWRVDSDAGRPAELVRFIERRLERDYSCAGKAVSVEITGEGTVSRGLKRKIRDVLEAAGASLARLDDRGEVEVLFPDVVNLDSASGSDVMLSVRECGLTDEEIRDIVGQAIADADLPDHTTVHIRADREPLITAILADAGVARIVRGSEPPVLLHPRLFAALETDDDGRVRIVARPAGDDDETAGQIEHELPAIAGTLAGQRVLLAWPGARRPYSANVEAVIAKIVAADAQRLELDNGVRVRTVHPVEPRKFVEVLGRRDSGAPPLSMLGVDATEGEADIPGIQRALGELAGDIDGRRVLVVVHQGDEDVVLPAENAVARAIRAALEPRVAALLSYGKDRSGAHFEVVHSTLESLPVGSKVRDPRG